MLDEGIKSLLPREPEFVVEIAAYSDPNALKDSIADFDAIVLSEGSLVDWIRTSEFLRAISPRKNLRVIIIRLEDNVLEVYEKKRLGITRNDDLINLIKRRSGGA